MWEHRDGNRPHVGRFSGSRPGLGTPAITRRASLLTFLLFVGGLGLGACLTSGEASTTPDATSRSAYVGNAVCATCHADISRKYAPTPMALTSGPAKLDQAPASVHNEPSRIDYKIFERDGRAVFSYERPGDATTRGEQRLAYYVGSGRRGRSFLFDLDGFLFQAPVSYYAQRGRWDVSPDDGSKRQMPFNRAIDTSCLSCHASQLRPVARTQNGFASPAFAENGVGCERCHGPGGDHVRLGTPMVNPASLPPARRDSICAQCHLTGESQVERPGRHTEDFRPGDLLSDYASYFVYDGEQASGLRAVSHVQALAVSRCKVASGDRMSCLSCHDPHGEPEPKEQVAYFRARCLACHEQNPSEADRKHFASKLDCASCHMPKSASLDVDHTAVTDHRILREPKDRPAPGSQEQRLRPFAASDAAGPRGLGLAYAELAQRTQNAFPESEAVRLLNQALAASPNDAPVLTALGYLSQRKGDLDRASRLYATALEQDPDRVVALTNLAVIYAQRGRLSDASSLLKSALERNPGLSEAGVNFALTLCSQGDAVRARQALLQVLRFNPDMEYAKQLLREIDAGRAPCRVPPHP